MQIWNEKNIHKEEQHYVGSVIYSHCFLTLNIAIETHNEGHSSNSGILFLRVFVNP